MGLGVGSVACGALRWVLAAERGVRGAAGPRRRTLGAPTTLPHTGAAGDAGHRPDKGMSQTVPVKTFSRNRRGILAPRPQGAGVPPPPPW